ncbi:MAG TPA: hypothetical protein VG871_06445 [Vicinamibacterales bacterium]|nr:hypothetical protein [Vicinamibacterales bacterium]
MSSDDPVIGGPGTQIGVSLTDAFCASGTLPPVKALQPVTQFALDEVDAEELSDPDNRSRLSPEELEQRLGEDGRACLDELYRLAREAHGELQSLLIRANSVLAFEIVQVDDRPALRAALESAGGVIVVAPLKSRQRSVAKILSQYDGNAAELLDVVRASIAVEFEDQLLDVARALIAAGAVVAQRPRDRLSRPMESGYCDFQLHLLLSNNFVVELQLHLKAVLFVKEIGAPGVPAEHEAYEKIREIRENADRTNRPYSESEKQRIDGVLAPYKRAYRAARAGAQR